MNGIRIFIGCFSNMEEVVSVERLNSYYNWKTLAIALWQLFASAVAADGRWFVALLPKEALCKNSDSLQFTILAGAGDFAESNAEAVVCRLAGGLAPEQIQELVLKRLQACFEGQVKDHEQAAAKYRSILDSLPTE